MTPLEILKKTFGYESFRLRQEEAIHSVLSGRDTFVLMPTGGGKSLCYQIPALMLGGVALVVSPLIALMKDQVDALRVNGIRAAYLNSTLSFQQQEKVLTLVKENKVKLLYIAPERLVKNDNLLDHLRNVRISLIAIDEAHCISQWGHDFRPDYLMLARMKNVFPSVPVIALTATADRLTQKDILDKLELTSPNIFTSSFNRTNIRYLVQDKVNAFDRLLNFLSEHKDESGIIYCLSRRSTETLAEDLQVAGYNALPYHAGLDLPARTLHQDKFLKDDVKIIVATIAFGMGIDKSNVRFVVHMDVPKNIEGYYQETGRAGRDGLPCIALMFYSSGDIAKLKKFVMIENNPEQTAIQLRKLDEMARLAEVNYCRRKFLLNYFDENTTDYCGNCDVCLQNVEEYDATEAGTKALQAIQTLGEKFGAGYVVDFLWGSTSNKIQPDHKLLHTYASGNALSKTEWQNMLAGLVSHGYLVKTKGSYPVLKLTELGFRTIEKKLNISLTRKRLEHETLFFENKPGVSSMLLQDLKTVRRKLASEEGVPAFVVLSDASLEELATYLPLTPIDLAQISGFGETKIRKYGQTFLDVVIAYCQLNNVESKMQLKAPKIFKRANLESDTATKRLTLRLFKQGNTVAQIAEARKLAPSTIEGHIAFYIRLGKIPLDSVLAHDKIKEIEKAIDRVGDRALTPLKLELGDNYSFSEIRYVIAHRQGAKLEEPHLSYGEGPGETSVNERVEEYVAV